MSFDIKLVKKPQKLSKICHFALLNRKNVKFIHNNY